MKPLRLLFFLPSLFFAYLCIHLVTASTSLDKSMNASIKSETFIHGVGQAMDDPWLHHSALRFYFRKLLKEHANKRIWAGSDMFARTLWNQYQFAGTIEIMFTIAHAENNRQNELKWAKFYATILPDDKHAKALMAHAVFGHAMGEPLQVEGRW